MKSRASFLFIVLSLLLMALFIVDLAAGAADIPILHVWAALT